MLLLHLDDVPQLAGGDFRYALSTSGRPRAESLGRLRDAWLIASSTRRGVGLPHGFQRQAVASPPPPLRTSSTMKMYSRISYDGR